MGIRAASLRWSAAAVLLALPIPAAAQLSFPTSAEDYPEFYPTAYYNHGGLDWGCSRDTYRGHNGTDFGAGSWRGMAAGRDVRAAAAGIVEAAVDGFCDGMTTTGCDPAKVGFGNHVKVAMFDGLLAVYGHLKLGSVAVAVGDVVACGDLLGLMGASGNSTGPHLHFEIRDAQNDPVDPFAGGCSEAPLPLWTEQGAYGALPALDCGPPVDCRPVARLDCGARVTARNDAAGATTGNFTYGCDPGFAYTGPEIAYAFVAAAGAAVRATLTGLAADLDLYAVAGTACDGDDCLAASTNAGTSREEIAFAADAGEEVVLVVDGWEGAVSGFTLTVECGAAASEL